MENNRDWKGPVALVLAGLALFVALNGSSFGPPSMVVSAWRAESDARSFLEQPIPTVPPVQPAYPQDVPGFWHRFDFPRAPNVEIYANPPSAPWAGNWAGYVQSLVRGSIMSLVQLLQPILLLLLVWLIVRQLGRRPSAPAPAPGGQTQDLSRQPPEQSA